MHVFTALSAAVFVVCGCARGVNGNGNGNVNPIPDLSSSIDPSAISVSGLSSGADFVVQLQVAFSSVINGVGVFAGQPYHCAAVAFENDILVPPCWGTADGGTKPGCTRETPSPDVPLCENCPHGKVTLYDHCKRHSSWVNVSTLLDYVKQQSDQHNIDDMTHLKDTPVYLYRGTKDACYLKGSLVNVQTMFEALGAHVQFNSTTPSAHAWPTADWGTACGHGVIENCGYDGPGAALQKIYGGADSNGRGGTLLKPVEANNNSLFMFDQSPFMSEDNNGTKTYNETTPRATGFAPYGYIYVPQQCRQGNTKKCKLHFSFHGCGVVGGVTGDGYYDDEVHHLSFQRWGEANGIVIVYPKLQPHGGTTETQSGCWDAYAQTGADYALKSGVQMRAITQIITAVSGVTVV
eukprot:m.145788 g.145788  ORF g.145788 m.145788 type:complete len:407 (+) comp30454_c0_seq1:125-1345(+)